MVGRECRGSVFIQSSFIDFSFYIPVAGLGDFSYTYGDMADQPSKKGRYSVTVVRDKCIGAASCIAVSPATFKFDEENKAVVLGQKMDSDENVLLAAQSCPTAAIVVTDDETGEQVWPK